MKHIKQFEDNTKGSYWILPTDKRLHTALNKINCSDEFIKLMINNPNIKKYNYIFVKIDNYELEAFRYGWNGVHDSVRDELYEKKYKLKFKGYIMTTEDEVMLSINVKKYNL